MRKESYYHKKILTKKSGGGWDWEVLVWVKGGLFADLVLHNPAQPNVGKFNTEKDAEEDMKKKIVMCGLKLHV